ncbi:LacI family DNA-binding transcriptional regulator [Fluviicola taffensis]|uniref:Transcriptional regulator, LacI family n=1 Tax=Fluviicola taffensis (strain DSM 16823 / NCIMB 13979 / RW262) TaxID=755732 RepID=F2IB36_FLUTR|nr:LacI family DNA-binding transcriptional regulator [Fluviicola taffensis]AEA42119.1 transcriptional regulator, LacI family [Fluviicola taffensis DSM 16823]
MKSKRTSLADIAESLNVSKSTVSFVLNGKGKQFNISEATQKLILEKAKELNYVPNYFAKGLREGKTQTIGLVLADISNPFYSELSKAIQESLYEKGYSLFIVSTNDDATMELKLIRDLILRSVDALIIAPCNEIPALKPVLDETPIPVVWVDRIGDEFADFVGVDNYMEATMLIRKFSKSPKKVGILHPKRSDVMTIQLRIDGAKSACERQKIPFELAMLTEDEKESVAKMKQMIADGVDSFVALNNKVALHAIKALNFLKVEIPNNVRIISFDDSEAFSYFAPPVTALSQPVDGIGRETVERVMERLKESTENRKHLMMECSFIERGSH